MTLIRIRLLAVFENCQPATKAKFINKISLFNLLPGVIHLLELKMKSEQKAEKIILFTPN